MPTTTNSDNTVYILIAAVCISVLLLVCLWSLINDFSKELKYLNDEIRRTDGTERKRWIRRRRRLWLSLIPFVKY